MLQKPFGYAVFKLLLPMMAVAAGFQFFVGILNGVSFVRSVEHIKVVFAVAEDDELSHFSFSFSSRTAFALEAVFGMTEPLLVGVDVFGVDNVVGFAVFFVKWHEFLRVADAGDIEKIAARELFCRIHLAGTGAVFTRVSAKPFRPGVHFS